MMVEFRLKWLALMFAVFHLAGAKGQNITEPIGNAYYPCTAPGTHLVVCVAMHQEPNNDCSPGGDIGTYSGFDWEVLRVALETLGCEYIPKCMHFQEVLDSVKNKTCDIGGQAVLVNTDRMDDGILLSFPVHTGSLGVMVPVQIQNNNGWFFLKPFNVSVWAAILVSLLMLPLLAFAIESCMEQGHVSIRGAREAWNGGLHNMYWDFSWLTMTAGTPAVNSMAARIIVLGYGILAMVLVSCYTSNLTAFLTLNNVQSRIRNIKDLRGRAVGTFKVWEERLKNKLELPAFIEHDLATGDIQAINGIFPWYRVLSDEEKPLYARYLWMTKLRAGKLAAFVHSAPRLQYIDRVTGCDLKMLGETFDQYDNAFPLRNDTNTTFLNALNAVILALKENGTLEELRDEHIHFPEPECDVVDTSSSEFSITFVEVWGIWVVYGAMIVIGLLVAWFVHWRRKKLRQLAGYGNAGTRSVHREGAFIQGGAVTAVRQLERYASGKVHDAALTGRANKTQATPGPRGDALQQVVVASEQSGTGSSSDDGLEERLDQHGSWAQQLAQQAQQVQEALQQMQGMIREVQQLKAGGRGQPNLGHKAMIV